MGDLEDHSTVASSQFADLLKVIILQFPHLLLLRQKGLEPLPLLLVKLQLLQLLLQGLQVGPAPRRPRSARRSTETLALPRLPCSRALLGQAHRGPKEGNARKEFNSPGLCSFQSSLGPHRQPCFISQRSIEQ